ncbi:hypothetical protein [Streptomyces sp. NPDC048551]|uniref:hypothetical protein n=1 Tax=Streptomyces sp. NPDC048551 TaxID=3155758 RepID=UPI003444D664
MRHPLHVAVPVTPPGPRAAARPAARHRRPRRDSALRAGAAAPARVPPARRLAAGLGLTCVLVATALTALVLFVAGRSGRVTVVPFPSPHEE